MSAYTNIRFRLNSPKDAERANQILQSTAAKRTPEFGDEIKSFISNIEVEGNEIDGTSYSLSSNTFCELIPQIMMQIARCNFGTITMDAAHCSCSGGYEAVFNGRTFKNGSFRLTFKENE